MLRQMERSAMHLLAKRGKSQRQIAEELGRNRRTVARALREPVDRAPAKRYRRSKVDPYRPQIAAWLGAGLTAARMLALAREDPTRPYRMKGGVGEVELRSEGSHSALRDWRRGIRRGSKRWAGRRHRG